MPVIVLWAEFDQAGPVDTPNDSFYIARTSSGAVSLGERITRWKWSRSGPRPDPLKTHRVAPAIEGAPAVFLVVRTRIAGLTDETGMRAHPTDEMSTGIKPECQRSSS